MILRVLFFFLFVFSTFHAQSQHGEINMAMGLKQVAEHDSSKKYKNVADFFKKGEFEGHGRYFFMATDNSHGLGDSYANAFGMGIGYSMPRFHGFSVSMSGFFIYNLGSSDLAAAEPLTGQKNRYEIGLFDVQNPHNHHDLDRLEDLNISYKYKGLQLKFGKQHINTVFINPQDGRMRPTLIEGLTASFNTGPKITFYGGWIFGASPRSTVKWFQIGQSVGIYPEGLSADGAPAEYAEQVRSNWLSYAGLEYKPKENVRLFLWDQVFDNVNNTFMFQPEWTINKGKSEILLASQFIRQQTIGNGGNEQASLRYAEIGSYVNIFGGRLEFRRKQSWSIQLNYTNIGNTGRFLMPREWGRDPFFTFMPRERNEGYGDVKALNMILSLQHKKLPLTARLGAGRYDLPDAKNAALNKYGFPSYYHFITELRYKPKGFIEGLEFFFLMINKIGFGKNYDNLRFIHNKVDLSNFNLIIQYSF
jgi:hypothetical protein